MVNKNAMKAFTLALVLASGCAFAQATPLGLWKVIDGETKQSLSYVRIGDAGGVLSGRMETLLDPSRQDAKCEKCIDERKNQPMLGMTIMRNVKATDDGVWEGGEILDPNNGKVYRVRLKPLDAGKVLEVRGYLGPFFRNQHCLRVNDPRRIGSPFSHRAGSLSGSDGACSDSRLDRTGKPELAGLPCNSRPH